MFLPQSIITTKLFNHKKRTTPHLVPENGISLQTVGCVPLLLVHSSNNDSLTFWELGWASFGIRVILRWKLGFYGRSKVLEKWSWRSGWDTTKRYCSIPYGILYFYSWIENECCCSVLLCFSKYLRTSALYFLTSSTHLSYAWCLTNNHRLHNVVKSVIN